MSACPRARPNTSWNWRPGSRPERAAVFTGPNSPMRRSFPFSPSVAGIGRWTAEMFLIFCLLRPDVFPVDDLGLLRALSELYGSEKGKRSAAEQFGEQWEPWRSCATWHLWRHLDPVPVAY